MARSLVCLRWGSIEIIRLALRADRIEGCARSRLGQTNIRHAVCVGGPADTRVTAHAADPLGSSSTKAPLIEADAGVVDQQVDARTELVDAAGDGQVDRR